MSESMIERLARAMTPQAWGPLVEQPDSVLKPEVRERFHESLKSLSLTMAAKAIAAIEAAGYVIVPREPTEDMVLDGCVCDAHEGYDPRAIWKAMIESAAKETP